MLDMHLAALYQVATGNFNRAVQRNQDRFPEDFIFQLDATETADLKCQFGISSSGDSHGGRRRSRPYAFTEQGVAMLSSVLRTKRAAAVNVAIMRTFVRLRQFLASHEEVAQRLDALERQQFDADARLANHDEHIHQIFEAIRQLVAPVADPARRRIGYPTSHETSE